MTPGTGSSQLLAFIKFLRSKDVPVSPADTLDAVHAAGLLGYEDRTKLRDGLAAVLAKSTFEQSAYLEAFDLFLHPSTLTIKPQRAQRQKIALQNLRKPTLKITPRRVLNRHRA